MRRILLVFFVLILAAGCGGNSGGSGDGAAPVGELRIGEPTNGNIAQVGEVDWYHFRAVEANSVLQIRCTGYETDPPLEFLVSVFEEDNSGNRTRIYADHVPEDAYRPANLSLNIAIGEPRDLLISVRDLLDDEASERHQYTLTLNYVGASDGNDSFADALRLGVGPNEDPHADSINAIGDVDCYRFTAPNDGVYSVNIDFTGPSDTPVTLGIDIFDDDGVLIESYQGARREEYRLISYLPGGEYFIVIDDQGRDHFDSLATYEIGIAPVEVDEALQNETRNQASDMEMVSGTVNPTYTIQGAIEYAQDQDWYAVPMGTASSGIFKVLKITFDGGELDGVFNYQITLADAGGASLFQHSFRSGSPVYTSQVLAGEGEHYISVTPDSNQKVSESAPYTLTVEVVDVDDPAENAGDGNDQKVTADALTADVATIGKIGYRTDEDWYRFAVDNAAAPKILEIFFETDSASLVEYTVFIMTGDQLWKISDPDGSDGPTELKTSFYVPVDTDPTNYFFKVCDSQGDDGDDVEYRITVSEKDIPASVSSVPGVTGTTPEYFSEIHERSLTDTESVDIELEISYNNQPHFTADTQLLQVAALTGSQYTSPWIAGYIDYDGDQDWYKMDIRPFEYTNSSGPQDPPADWYYDVSIRLYSPGSDTEYTWKMYRDRSSGSNNTPGVVIDNTTHSDGFFAANGDSTITNEALDITTPGSGDEFWVGSRWGDDSFFISISDFNFIRLNADDTNPNADNDWGYDAPYYFQVVLTYHPEEANP